MNTVLPAWLNYRCLIRSSILRSKYSVQTFLRWQCILDRSWFSALIVFFPSTLNGDTISENLKNILGRVFDQAIVMQEKTTKDLFSEKGRTALVSLSANGTFANLNVKIGIQMDFCLDIVRQMVISALIPQAWEFHRELWDKGAPANAVYFSKPFFM